MSEFSFLQDVLEHLPKCWRINSDGQKVRDHPVFPGLRVYWESRNKKTLSDGVIVYAVYGPDDATFLSNKEELWIPFDFKVGISPASIEEPLIIERLKAIAESVTDWDNPIGARADLYEACRQIEKLSNICELAIKVVDSSSLDDENNVSNVEKLDVVTEEFRDRKE